MRQFRREFVKILFQKRTFFGWAGLFLVPFIITIAIRVSGSGGGPHGGNSQGQGADFFFNLIESNGLYVVIGSLFALVTFLLPLLACMAGSQTIAGEAENGTLRTVLMQPVHRGSLLVTKWFVAMSYIAIGLLVLAIGALISGGAFFGFGSLILLTGDVVGTGEGLLLILFAYLFVLFAMAAVVSLAMTLSTLTNSGLTAMAGSLVLVIIMLILGSLSVFEFLRPYLFTSHFTAWIEFFSRPVDWAPVRDALINFAVWSAGMTGIAWFVFKRKDILS